MAYGQGEYGQRAYGGSSFETGGPQLVSSDPPDLDTGIAEDVVVTINLDSNAGLDLNTLSVDFDGSQAIVGGLFQTGYAGTISQDPETDVIIVISTHPVFSSGSVTTNIAITDLAGFSATPSFSFTVGADEIVAESLTVSDAVAEAYDAIEGPAESLTLSEGLNSNIGFTVGESLTVSDAVQEDVETPIAESLTLSEGLVSQQDQNATTAESVSASEALSFEFGVGVFDTALTVSDSVGVETSVPLAESLTASDSVGLAQAGLASVAESLTVSDATAAVHAVSEGLAESLTLSEALGFDLGLGIQDPALSAADSVATQQDFTLPVVEFLTVSDTTAVVRATSEGLAESLTLSEGLVVDVSTTVDDVPLSASDSLTSQQAQVAGLAESLTVSGSVVLDTDLETGLAESLTVSEGLGISVQVVLAESLTVSDAVTSQLDRDLVPAESLTASDAVGLGQDLAATIPETVSLGDLVDIGNGFVVADALTISEGVTTSIPNTVNVGDTLSLAEGLGTGQDYYQQLVESLTVSDAALISRGEALGFLETYNFSEQLSTGSFQIVTGGTGRELTVYFTQQARFDRVTDLRNHTLRPTVGSTGVPVRLIEAEPVYNLYQTGSSAFADPLTLDSPTTDRIQINGVLDPINDIGSYIEILNGQNSGLYRILTVEQEFPGIARVHRELFVKDEPNGYVTEDYIFDEAGTQGPTTSPAFTVGSSSVDRPVLEVFEIQNRTQSWTETIPPATWSLANGNELTINTSQSVNPGDIVVVKMRLRPAIEWRHISAALGVKFTTTKFTNLGTYEFESRNLRPVSGGRPFTERGTFTAQDIPAPRLLGVEPQEDGSLIVRFNDFMRKDASLTNPGDYVITGPEDVRVLAVKTLDDNRVRLDLSGILAGTYGLTVSIATPKDLAGNPLDPTFNSAIFTSSTPLTVRSVFTDKGPIAKPPLTLATGTGATVQSFTEVEFPGATFTSAAVGQYITLSGGTVNGGTFQVIGFIDAENLKLQASFSLPDAATLDWELFDPRNGEIADDPADVEVRVNGSPVTVESVIGLLGQIVLEAPPATGSDVKVDYSFCCNPVVEIRRLNSKEFRLNAWNRDKGYLNDGRQHNYRYNNVLVSPSDFDVLDPRAKLDAPEQRDLKYRAYERAYTPVLNDPNLLTLNSPLHRIAYPPARRVLTEEFLRYEASTLPENDGWTRVGAGSASTLAGVLTVEDDSSGTFPTGQPIYWTRGIDLSFDHVFAASWRFSLDLVTEPEGIFTGVAAGYSDETVAVVVGFLEDGGVRKVGLLKRGATDPSDIASWTGGLNSAEEPTFAPSELDWSTLRSYRLYRDLNGTVRLFVDGDVVATLQATSDELPFLEQVVAPFDTIQGVFFGSLSRPARSTSSWDFYRYLILPTNSQQSAPSSFVSYEANVLPEDDAKPWTPIGSTGYETILDTDFLLLGSTSASDASGTGIVTGDFRGLLRLEPLLSTSSQVILDAQVTLVSHTHGIDPYGLMMAVDDGNRLLQVSFLSDVATTKLSYGGRSLPGDFSPFSWGSLGGESASMAGRRLRITDTTVGDGLVYFIEDNVLSTSPDRVVDSSFDYILDCRMEVVSYVPDGSGYAGAFSQVFDGLRLVGIQLAEVAGIRYVQLMSDGTSLAQFAFEWNDGEAHTFRLRKNTSGNLVTLFADGVFVGSLAYSSFTAAAPSPTGIVSFGSSTSLSAGSTGVVDWEFCNAIRVPASQRRYVGLWKGTEGDSLTGYHLPTKATGINSTVTGNVLEDTQAAFLTANVVAGDLLVVDVGSNKGTYEVASVVSQTILTIVGTWPSQPSEIAYRVVKETNWSTQHKYRLFRDSTGEISLLLDTETEPLLRVSTSSITIPSSGTGIVKTLSGGLPSVVFGSFSGENLAVSLWDFVRYGITRSPTEQRIAPHHQFLNQWNVMHSPERLRTTIPHELTDFKSSSTGIVPKKDPDLFENSALIGHTLLNQDTPIVPLTQNSETRKAASPYPTQEYISALNRPEDFLNNDGDFTLNDGTIRFRLIVPDDVLYNSLDIIEASTGEEGLIKPFDDECQPNIGTIYYTEEHCLSYDGAVLPENDATAATPWTLNSDDPPQVNASAVGGILTYGTGLVGTKTVYLNNTPLPDAPSLISEASFRVRVANDGTAGTDDSQIRLGLSAPGLTVGLAFVTVPDGRRFVLILDVKANQVLGSASFDFLDGNYHTYRIVRDPGKAQVRVFIDS